MNGISCKLMSTLSESRAAYDAIWEREKKKDKAYAELEAKCNEALKDLEKNPLVLDLRAKIILATLHSKIEGLEIERERLKKSEVQVLQEIGGLKQDRVAIMQRCTACEEVAILKVPFELEKMHGTAFFKERLRPS
nr:hypothetical protein [Tanacetum cinerariifolium]